MRWSDEISNNWGKKMPVLIGCNYLPKTAINSIDMFQELSYDKETIENELAYASKNGINGIRVFIPFAVWENEREKFIRRFDEFLEIAWKNKIYTMPVLFDDCNFSDLQPKLGVQEPPVDGIHNSRWTASPGWNIVDNDSYLSILEEYVKSVIKSFKNDDRIFCWDLYNEPLNRPIPGKTFELLKKVFDWSNAGQMQPSTVGVWQQNSEFFDLVTTKSDVLSFHCYFHIDRLKEEVETLKKFNRPIICTEWLHRENGSVFDTCLKYMYENGISTFCWGLFAGKTQTYLNWDISKNSGSDPTKTKSIWQHDIFYSDGTPYNKTEIDLILSLRNKN